MRADVRRLCSLRGGRGRVSRQSQRSVLYLLRRRLRPLPRHVGRPLHCSKHTVATSSVAPSAALFLGHDARASAVAHLLRQRNGLADAGDPRCDRRGGRHLRSARAGDAGNAPIHNRVGRPRCTLRLHGSGGSDAVHRGGHRKLVDSIRSAGTELCQGYGICGVARGRRVAAAAARTAATAASVAAAVATITSAVPISAAQSAAAIGASAVPLCGLGRLHRQLHRPYKRRRVRRRCDGGGKLWHGRCRVRHLRVRYRLDRLRKPLY